MLLSTKPVHRWNRIRMSAFIPIKLLVLLERNSNDEMLLPRHFGINLYFILDRERVYDLVGPIIGKGFV